MAIKRQVISYALELTVVMQIKRKSLKNVISDFNRILKAYYFFLILAAVTLFSNSVYSQVHKLDPRESAIGLGGSQPKLELNLIAPQGNKIKFQPNSDSFYKIDLYVFGLGLGFGIKNDKNDETIYGQTKYHDYQFRFKHESIQIEAFYQRYSGYYIENSSQIDSSHDSSGPFILMPNMQASNLRLQTIYTYNDNFSLQHAFGLSEIQDSSAGSFLLLTGISNFKLENAMQSFVPNEADSTYGLADQLTAIETLNLSVGLGLAYTYIYRGFFISGLVFLNPTIQKRSLEFLSTSESKVKLEVDGSLKLALGWNQDSWKISFQLQADGTSVKLDDESEVSATTFEGQAQIAYRF